MAWVPEWLGRTGRPLHDMSTEEWRLYREEITRILGECLPVDQDGRDHAWVWRESSSAGSHLLTPVFAAREYAEQHYPGCKIGWHPGYGLCVFWNDRLFIWPPATPEQIAQDAVVGGFFAFGEEVAEDDPRQVLAQPDRDIVHETAGHLSGAQRAAGRFPPRADDGYVWVLENTASQTWVRRYPLVTPPGPEQQETDDGR